MARRDIAKHGPPAPGLDRAGRATHDVTRAITRVADSAERALQEIDVCIRTYGRDAVDAALGGRSPDLVSVWQRLRTLVMFFDSDVDVPPNPHAGGPTPPENAWTAKLGQRNRPGLGE